VTALAPVRWSNLRHMGRSPAHYRHNLLEPFVATPAMVMGSLVHELVLQGGRDKFAVYEGDRRAGKDWEAFKADTLPGVTIVKASEMDEARAIAAAVRSHPAAWDALAAGQAEVPLSWTIAGRACRGTPDVLGLALTDLKVTNDASPDRFTWHARKMGWLGQLAWYYEAARQTQPILPNRVSIVAVESTAPYVVTVFDLTDNALDLGTKTWRLYFERLRACEESDCWPGYVEGVAQLDVPETEDELILEIDGEELRA
jgi:exodeoxyribonuclease VIII